MTRSSLVACACACAVALAGCSRSREAAPDAAPGPPASAVILAASASASARASAAPVRWSVKYAIAAGTLYIPDTKDWSSTKFKNDPERYLGEGTLTLTVDPSGRVSGTSAGAPLGDAILDGRLEGDALAATVRRKDPADLGLTGTLSARLAGDELEGTMTLADAKAAAVREAKLSGSKGRGR